MIHIYGKDNCQYCSLAKKWLFDKGVEFEYIDITNWTDDDKTELVRKYKRKTVPIIIDGDKIIGGYTELVKENIG